MRSTINFMDANYQKIKQMRAKWKQYAPKNSIPSNGKLTPFSQFSFLGFEAGYKKSEVTTGNRLYYDRSRPYKKDIPSKEYKSVKKLPYLQRILFQSVLEYYGSIKSNEITFTRLAKDTLIEVESYKIADYKTSTWRTLYP
jgi:hypothetical protein